MTYREKAEKFREMAFAANRLDPPKWRDREEVVSYFESWGGRVKENRRRRRGYLVTFLQGPGPKGPTIVAEVPMDFAERVFLMGGFP